MFLRRRLALQLTPLLDLLLIVMFSQYIENRNVTRAAEQEMLAQKSQLQSELNRRRDELEREFAEDRKTLEDLRKVYDERFRSLVDQHHQIGTLLAESLNLPGAAVAEILKLRTSGSAEDAERLTEATERLQALLKARGEEVFRFLIKVDEMQKHVSVWEVHIQDNGQAWISDGDQSAVIDFESDTEFSGRLFEASKSFADSRTLIILLLTWGDAQGRARQRASDGMPLLTEKLRRDADGTRWYDFSVVGFRDEGPIFSKVPP